MSTASRKPLWRRRWWTPLVSLIMGLLILTAAWIGEKPEEGVIGLVVMTVLAIGIFALDGRSETIRGLGPERDERWAMIDLRATAFTAMAMIAYLLGAWLYELSQGDDGQPYAQVAAVGGVAYVAAIAYLRWRG